MSNLGQETKKPLKDLCLCSVFGVFGVSGFWEASAVDVDAEELISRESWSIGTLPALGHY